MQSFTACRMPIATNLLVLAVICCIGFGRCTKLELKGLSGIGKRPVYIPVEALDSIANLAPQAIQQSGTIYLLDTLFFMLEQKKGIHVFNIKDSLNVQALTFIKIPAVSDFAISGNRLYADSWRDLLTIDISDLFHIEVLDRKVNVFSPALYPPLYDGIFECVDESRGAVVDWEDVELENVFCQTTR